MTDLNRKNVIKGLECLADENSRCYSNCPYFMERGSSCFRAMAREALILLRDIVQCKDCKWYDKQISMCNNCALPREQTFFCADGKLPEENKR